MAYLNFKGKQIIQNYHFSVPYREIRLDAKKSFASNREKVDLSNNLIIHGDNLHALKSLLPLYAGKIKCIYIDPPYNTGNEHWKYSDSVANPMLREWFNKEVTVDDATRHDKWLCMMLPRLKLLRELMRDDGVIFVSINDIELHNLRGLMDEIFNDGFVANIVRQTIKGGTGPSDSIRLTHDYVLCYARDKEFVELSGLKAEEIELNLKDKNGAFAKGRELNKWGAGSKREDSPSMWFPIPGPKGEKVFPIRNDGSEGRWRWGKRRMLEAVENGDVIFEKRANGTYIVYEKVRSNEGRSKSYQSLFLDKYTNATGTEEVKLLFNDKSVFDYPKPTELIKTLCRIANVSDGDIVLDSFAGSGSTAQAVLALNHEDGESRKFILIECQDYADEITAERVRRVIKGVGSGKKVAFEGLSGSFSFCELGEPIESDGILSGEKMPSWKTLARYVFYSATGHIANEKKMDEKKGFIGETSELEVYMFYVADSSKLKNIALTLDNARAMGKPKSKRRLVFAPAKYLEAEQMEELKISFAQLPWDIYRHHI